MQLNGKPITTLFMFDTNNSDIELVAKNHKYYAFEWDQGATALLDMIVMVERATRYQNVHQFVALVDGEYIEIDTGSALTT